MNKVIFLFLFLVPLISLGQESKYLKPDYDQEIDFGIRVGYGVTNYSEFKRSDLPDGYDLRNYGYGGGVFMQLRVNHIYFQPEILFGHVSTVIAAPLPDNNSVTGEIDLNFESVQIPLIIGYRFSPGKKNSFRIGGGIFFNFLLGTSGQYIEKPGDTIDIPSDFFKGFNDLTVAGRFNLGFDAGNFLFDLAYQTGFSRLSEELGQLGIDFKELGRERSWSLAVGYKFIKTKR